MNFLYSLFGTQAVLRDRDEAFQNIQFIHGTNSAILSMLPQMDMELCSTGDLLNRGIAPMSGEIRMGGLNTDGVNQDRISGGTINDIDKCWNRYAANADYSFQESELTEEKFVEHLEKLEKTSPDGYAFDPTIVALTRFKQWNKEQFDSFCQKYQGRIDAYVARMKKYRSPEDNILKALDYDLDKLERAIDDHKLRAEILEELNYHHEVDDYLDGTFNKEKHYSTGGSVAPEKTFEGFALKAGDVDCILFDIINLKLAGLLHKEQPRYRKKYVPYDHIKERMMWRKANLPDTSKQRVTRLFHLFDPKHTPLQFKTVEDKRCLTTAFPILLGSTKLYPGDVRGTEKVIKSGARLGEDIDVMVVRPENYEFTAQWLNNHRLARRISVYSIDSVLGHEIEKT